MTLEQAHQEFFDNAFHNSMNPYISDESKALAMVALAEKIERENPNPLTLDELRDMNGEPVWFVKIYGNYKEFDGKWAILFGYEKTNGNFLFTNSVGVQHVYNEDKYGETWVAYKYKPKGVK